MHGKCTHTHMVVALLPCWTCGRGSPTFGQSVVVAAPRLLNRRTMIFRWWDTGVTAVVKLW